MDNDLNLNVAAIVALVPITTAIVSGVKQSIKPLAKYGFFIALPTGEGLTWLAAGAGLFGLDAGNWAATTIVGLLVWLASAGLWSGVVKPAMRAPE